MKIEIITTKILNQNLGKKIKFKKKNGWSGYLYGTIYDVAGRAREFNCGSDWHSFASIKEFYIIEENEEKVQDS